MLNKRNGYSCLFWSLVVLSLALLCLFSSCQKNSERTTTTETSVFAESNAIHIPNENPVFDEETCKRLFEALDIKPEKNYDKIEAHTQYPVYSIGSEQISCSIINRNVGKGFELYSIMFVERQEHGEWKRLDYQPQEIRYAQWLVIGEENNTTRENETIMYFFPRMVNDQLKAGSYRLIFFVGEKVLYAEFAFTE